MSIDRSTTKAVANGNGVHIGTQCLATTHAFDPQQRQAEARRLAACWNACKGLPTDDLEQCPSGGLLHLAGHADQLLAQRDELLAELQRIADAEPSTWEPEIRDQFQQWAQNRARHTIAKVTGGAA